MFAIASKAKPYFGAVVLTTALLTAAGVWCLTRMPSGVYPEVTFPRIAVVARVNGLSVPNMEAQVTQPLEQALSTVTGVAQVRSKTIRGGSEISLDFNPGADIRHGEQMSWNRIASIRSQLPGEAEITVEQMTPSIFPILSVVLTGGENATQLRDYAYYNLAPLIKNVPDVLYANVAGGDLREIEVEVRPDDLLAAGLSAADLADQIAKVHRLQPVGRIEREPLAYQLILNTQAKSAGDVENLVVSARGGLPIRVRDVADVKVFHQDRQLSIGYRGKDAVVVTVFRSLGGNTVAISQAIRQLLKRQPPPKGIEAAVGYDEATFVQTAIVNVRDAIAIGGLFSVVILFAFLKSWRATLIATLAIPTTLGITFLFLHGLGETLNLMSLGGLAVAIGLIIDDAVVVIENIVRHMAPKRTGAISAAGNDEQKVDAVDAASEEISGAVIGSTLTTVVVFLPLAFIVGVYGQFFASLSRSLSIAVLVSMVMSLTLIPVFAAKFLAGRKLPSEGPIFRLLARIYDAVLAVALWMPRTTMLLSLASTAVAVLLFTGVPNPKSIGSKEELPPLAEGLKTGLMPVMDEGAFVLDYWAPAGSPLETTEKLVHEIEEVLTHHPDIDAFVRRTGAELGLFATQTNRGDIQIVVRPAEEDLASLWNKPVRPDLDDLGEMAKGEVRRKFRRKPVTKIMQEVEDEIKHRFAEHQLKIEMMQIMQDELDDLSGANKPIEVKLFGPDHHRLGELAEQVAEVLEKKGKGHGLHEINSNVTEGNPDLMIHVDGVLAAKMGITADAVERQLKAIFLGQVATQVRESAARIVDVRVRHPDRLRFGRGRFDPQRLLEHLIILPDDVKPVAAGGDNAYPILRGITKAVPLAALATVEFVRTPDEQHRENQQPAIFVTAALEDEGPGLSAIVEDIREWMRAVPMPPGYRWEIGGHYLQQQRAFQSLLVVMALAVALIFIMLAFQFQSLVLPLLIFMTQPMSLACGMLALWLTNTPLNVSSYMGAILLVGLDMKNGILLVEYIQRLRRGGMDLKPALKEAGHTRFRPILMTSLAAIFGLLPLAFGIGPGAQMQQPLAIMVIGGLTANMLFTRLVIPAGYLILENA